MYKDDIRKLYSEKREARWYILRDFIKIYFSLKIGFPNLEKERQKLVELVQLYFSVDRNETKVLASIKKQYGSLDDHEGIDELLDEFDSMFDDLYRHCERTFLDYEEVIADYGDLVDWIYYRIKCKIEGTPYNPAEDIRYRMKHYPINFPLFDEKYKQKMLEYVSHLPKPEEVDF